MPVLLAIIKLLAVLLLILALVLLVALLLPLGFSFEYHPGRFRVAALYGPLRRTVWAHHTRPRKRERPSAEEKAAGVAVHVPLESAPAPEKEPASAPPPAQPKVTPESGPQVLPTGEFVPPVKEVLPPDEEEAELPSGAMGRLERMITLLEEDPRALAKCVLAHMRWLDRHSFFKIKVRHLYVYWTVTCEDAANTAVAYGAEMAALNTALALVQQTVRLQSDCLWLEPDFTGQCRANRKISFVVSASAILMIHLLYRIWKDPLLQPTTQPEPQKL